MNYKVMDGRAAYDVDGACVVECFQSNSDKSAKKYIKKNYQDEDVVLVNDDDEVVY